MSDGPLICLHITKTAGGTLKSALRGLAGKNVQFLYGQEDLQRLKAADLSKIDIIYGHAIYGVHEKLGIAPNYMAFLRHPVTRTISHYHHLRNVEPGPLGDRIRASADINDFFANHEHWEFSNLMARIISGLANRPETADFDMLQTAKDHIAANFRFVGFQEFFPFSVRKVAALIGQGLDIGKEVNVGNYSFGAVSPATLDRIDALNRVDMDLFRHCLPLHL